MCDVITETMLLHDVGNFIPNWRQHVRFVNSADMIKDGAPAKEKMLLQMMPSQW
jgi:hypothetical protein